jgi:hypothetical protein
MNNRATRFMIAGEAKIATRHTPTCTAAQIHLYIGRQAETMECQRAAFCGLGDLSRSKGSPVDPNLLYASQTSAWFGPKAAEAPKALKT